MNNQTPKKFAPFGAWESRITPELLVQKKIQFGSLKGNGEQIVWTESRPEEQGRCAIVFQANPAVDVLGASYSAKSRIHEYGGAAFCLDGNTVYFVNESDQQVYVLKNKEVRQLTQEPDTRFGDLMAHPDSPWMVSVAERHHDDGTEPQNLIVIIHRQTGAVTPLVEGHDFYAYPQFSPDATRLCWISWDHPNMPWDQTALYHAHFDVHTGQIDAIECVYDRTNVSVFQPQYSPDNTLFYVADPNGWWQLYRQANPNTPIIDLPMEFGLPLWLLGFSTYCFIDSSRIACSVTQNATSRFGIISLDTDTIDWWDLPVSGLDSLQSVNQRVYAVATFTTQADQLIEIDPATKRWQKIKSAASSELDSSLISQPQAIEFPTRDGDTAHGFFYAPVNPEFQAPQGSAPPLLVFSHGGPTTHTSGTLNLKIQFWTSRGFAVLDVNYRGSTGYGRAYRDKLYGHWGEYDVIDCESGAHYAAERAWVDPDRLLIRGGSAGGYTTLCALTFGDTFKAGASYYGISDLMVLAQDTHKFEARYLDHLIGPLPQAKADYEKRSPINSVDRINCPIIFLQGLQDKVVPPTQSECLVNALRSKKLPVAYVVYENERHGFRDAQAIIHSIQAELYFYQRVLNLPTTGSFSIPIENLD